MLVKEFQDYVIKLENASTKNNLDQIREDNKHEPWAICCRAILGNFWNDPVLSKCVNVVVEVLGHQRGSSPSFITNRVALIIQLLKHPRLDNRSKELLQFRLDNLMSEVTRSVREAILLAGQGKSSIWSDTLIDKRSVNDAIICFVISDIYNKRHNLGCYLLMSQLGSVTANFDAFCSNPLVKEKIKEGVLSASTSSSLTRKGLAIIQTLYPEIYDISVHGPNYSRELAGA